MKGLPDLGARGEGWVVLQVVLLVLLVLAGLLAGDAWGGTLVVLTTLTGAALLLAAALLVGRGFLDLGRNLTPVPRPRDDATLVETGVYRLVRHPLYGGIIVGSIGVGLLMASPLALLLACLVALSMERRARWRGREEGSDLATGQ